MQGLRQPVGDQPPEVYWKRRLTLLGIVLLVILVVWFLVTSPSGEEGSPSPTLTPTATPTPDITTSADAGTARACGPDDVQFTTVANPGVYPGGALPNFDVDIEHVGDTPCLLDTAAEGTELLVVSGNDRIWSSTDCPAESPINARQFLMQPGATEEFQVTWPRTRSREECVPVSAIPLPGTYRATLTIQGISSPEARFQLED